MNTFSNYEEARKVMMDKSSTEYIDNLNLTIKEIEKNFRLTKLSISQVKREVSVEQKLMPPSFIIVFYAYMFENKKIPSQAEYLDYYYQMNSQWIQEKVDKTINEAFLGRLSRTYVSLVRDVHFYILLRESKWFSLVLHDIKSDLTEKVDVFVKSKKGYWYGLQLRVDTPNSQSFYEIKPTRGVFSKVKKDWTFIDMPLNLNTAKAIITEQDLLKVYYYKELREVKGIIENFEKDSPSLELDYKASVGLKYDLPF